MKNSRRTERAMARLSSGLRINKALDDPAGLSVANRMRREIKGLGAAQQNSLDGISLIQTADGALNEVHAILERMRELTVYAANDTFVDSDRMNIQLELNELLDEIDNIGRNTAFNGRPLFNGIFENADDDQNHEHGIIKIRTGTGRDNLLHVRIEEVSTAALGIRGPAVGAAPGDPDIMLWNLANLRWLNPEAPHDPATVTPADFCPDSIQLPPYSGATSSANGWGLFNPESPNCGRRASVALDMIDASIADISRIRAQTGAYENRLTQTVSIVQTSDINLQSALSRMADTDMAMEMTRYSKHNVIGQAGLSILSMANQRPQQILSLLNF